MGWLATIGLNATLGLAGYLGSRHAFRQPRGIPRALAAAVLAWTWAILGMQILGNLGLLRVEALFAWAASGLAISAAFRFFRPAPGEPPKEQATRLEASATVAIGLAIWVLVILLGPTVALPVRIVSDGPIYHLYFAARWWKEGRLFLIASPFGENAATYFPAGGELWFTWLMVGFGGESPAKAGQLPFLLMAATAAFGMARRSGAGRSASTIAVAWFVTCMPLLIFSFEANVDTIFTAGYLTCAYFLLRFALGDGDLDALALAGLSAGGAWGTKPTATVFVPVLLVLGFLAILRSGRGRAGRLALLLATTALPAGYWYARNAWIGGGNPLYPLQVSAFGKVLLPGWYESSAMQYSQFYIRFSRFATLAETLFVVFDPRLVPLWLAAILGAWAIGRRRPMAGWIWGFAGLSALNVALFWVLIPYRTQQRFMIQAIGLAAIPLAATLDRARAIRWLAVAVLAIHLTTTQAWPFDGTRMERLWDFSPIVPAVKIAAIRLPTSQPQFERLRASTDVGSDARMDLAATLGVGVGAMLAAVAWTRLDERRTPGRWAAALGVMAILLAGDFQFVASQYPGIVSRFPFFRDYLRGWIELDARTAPGTRIAYAGTNLPYILMGPGLKNDVFYVNINAHPGWLLHDYARAARSRGEAPWPTPRPGWDRLERDYDAWLENLEAERIQVFVACRAKPEDGLFNIADTQSFPIERVWAESHPESFTPLYGVAENEREFRFYRVHPAPRKKSGRNSTESAPRPH